MSAISGSVTPGKLGILGLTFLTRKIGIQSHAGPHTVFKGAPGTACCIQQTLNECTSEDAEAFGPLESFRLPMDSHAPLPPWVL